ncbi:hypothetical protein Tco_1244573 [Tanacetum coccineum]
MDFIHRNNPQHGDREGRRCFNIEGVKNEKRIISDIEVKSNHDPVMQCTTLLSHSESAQRFLFHFSHEFFPDGSSFKSIDESKIQYLMLIHKDSIHKES